MKGLLGLVVMVVMLLGGQAKADTDQLCLSTCINQGHGASVCMPQCTYNAKPKDDAVTDRDDAPVDNPYRVLDTVTPAPGTGPVETPAIPATQQAQLNRVCLQTCLKKGFSYGLCTHQCTQQDCPPNSILCRSQQLAEPPPDDNRGN